jgi:hypothetical protein
MTRVQLEEHEMKMIMNSQTRRRVHAMLITVGVMTIALGVGVIASAQEPVRKPVATPDSNRVLSDKGKKPAVQAATPGSLQQYAQMERRFEASANGWVIQDNETGLLWHTSAPTNATWEEAWDLCYRSTVGKLAGWRLPQVEELLYIMAVTEFGTLSLPSGFDVPVGYSLWSATPASYSIRHVAVRYGRSKETHEGAEVVDSAYGVRALQKARQYSAAQLELRARGEDAWTAVKNRFLCVRGGAGPIHPPLAPRE